MCGLWTTDSFALFHCVALDKGRRSALNPTEFAAGLSMHGVNLKPEEMQDTSPAVSKFMDCFSRSTRERTSFGLECGMNQMELPNVTDMFCGFQDFGDRINEEGCSNLFHRFSPAPAFPMSCVWSLLKSTGH
ncbi:unnamed protein product [Durusdinium trenchii]|uniref:Uncharacterized protein n=1 Tax=Durusdinium trenchii TaxID=1381693 RepID=A0ABP0L455_9DINO